MSTSGWVRRALARQRVQRGRVVTEEPDEKLVIVVKFGLAMTVLLSGWSLRISCCWGAGIARFLLQSQV